MKKLHNDNMESMMCCQQISDWHKDRETEQKTKERCNAAFNHLHITFPLILVHEAKS